MNIKLNKNGSLQEQSWFWLFKGLELQAHAERRDASGVSQRLADKALELALDLELVHWTQHPPAEGGPHE